MERRSFFGALAGCAIGFLLPCRRKKKKSIPFTMGIKEGSLKAIWTETDNEIVCRIPGGWVEHVLNNGRTQLYEHETFIRHFLDGTLPDPTMPLTIRYKDELRWKK